jgi:hypothetical protein
MFRRSLSPAPNGDGYRFAASLPPDLIRGNMRHSMILEHVPVPERDVL